MKKILLLILSVLIIAIFTCSLGGESSSGGGGGSTSSSSSSSSSTSSSDDMLSAVLDRIELDPTSIDNNGRINIKAFIKDGYDNIDYVNVYFFSPRQLTNNEGVRLWDWLDYDSVEDCFEGYIDIENYHEFGTWKIGEISIQDTDNKSCCYFIEPSMSNDHYSLSEYYGDPGEEVAEIEIIEVAVSNTTPDLDFPVMTGYTISPATVTDGETVNITVTITDTGGSGINGMYGGIRIDYFNGSKSSSTSGTDIGGGQYQCSIVMDSWYNDGIWYIDDIEIRDNADNITTYRYDDWINNDNLIMYHSDNENNYVITTFDVKSFVKN